MTRELLGKFGCFGEINSVNGGIDIDEITYEQVLILDCFKVELDQAMHDGVICAYFQYFLKLDFIVLSKPKTFQQNKISIEGGDSDIAFGLVPGQAFGGELMSIKVANGCLTIVDAVCLGSLTALGSQVIPRLGLSLHLTLIL